MSEIPFELQALAVDLLGELESERLTVAKIPGRDGEGFVGASITQNPAWYSRLCGEYLGTRRRYPKARTIIRRRDTVRTLKQLANGDRRPTLYQDRLIEVLRREADNRGGIA